MYYALCLPVEFDYRWDSDILFFHVYSPVGYNWWVSKLCPSCFGLDVIHALILCANLLSLFTIWSHFNFSWNNTQSHTQIFMIKPKSLFSSKGSQYFNLATRWWNRPPIHLVDWLAGWLLLSHFLQVEIPLAC